MANATRWKIRTWQRVLAIALVVVLAAELVLTDNSLLRGRDEAYRESEAYEYLKNHMENVADNWLERLYYGVSAWFYPSDSREGCMRRAAQCVSKRDLSGAREWLQKAAARDEGLTDAEQARDILLTACVSSLSYDYDNALALSKQAAALMPEDAETLHLVYRFSADAGDGKGAADALAEYATLTRDSGLYREIAETYMSAGSYKDSGRFYEMIMENEGESPELIYRIGLSSMFQGDYGSALADFARTEYPGSLYAQGVCYLTIGDGAAGEKCFASAIEKGEDILDARRMLAICRLQEDDYAGAEALLTEYIAAGGDEGEVAYYRAVARSLLGNLEGAIADYDTAVKSGVFAAESLFGAASCRFTLGQYAEAASGFEQCVAQGVHLSESYYYLGLSLMETGDRERAEAALQSSISTGKDTVVGGQ